MRRRPALACISAAPLAATPPGPAAAQNFDTAGVRYAPGVTVGGAPLQLNGAGIRHRFVVKVYTAGLYLTSRQSTPEAVIAAAGPKRMHVVMLRDIDANELGRLFTKAMEDNTPREEFVKSINGTLRMGEIFAAKKRLANGENFSVDWVPGQGTTILVNGRPQGDPIKEPEFFTALLRIWLGPKPPDAALKQALLGIEPARTGNQVP